MREKEKENEKHSNVKSTSETNSLDPRYITCSFANNLFPYNFYISERCYEYLKNKFFGIYEMVGD